MTLSAPYKDSFAATTGPVRLTTLWRRYEMNLRGQNLTSVIGAFAWIWMQPERRQTVWGTLLFLGIIVVSQGFIALKLAFTPSNGSPLAQAERKPRSVAFATAYSQQPGES